MLACLLVIGTTAGAQERFASPEAAARALGAAARDATSTERLSAILGPGSDEILSSGDPVDDAAARKRFVTAIGQKTRIERDGDAVAILHIGNDDWPFPIPIVRDGEQWRFDTASGKEELLNRRIGRNELTVISVGRTFVDAQHEYFARFRTYAQKLRSTPGQKDGLYWEETDGDVSPLGPLVAEATAEGYRHGESDAPPEPYHGYFFRVLKEQGKHGPGGARSYVRDGRMTDGFALVAYPADYGSSGVMTFVVGEQGVVYQKNLGAQTADVAKAMTAYDPDGSWEPTR